MKPLEACLRAMSKAGATGLEPATSGVTGVTKRLHRASSGRLKRVTMRVRPRSTRFPAGRFFAWFHPVVSMPFPGVTADNRASAVERVFVQVLKPLHERLQAVAASNSSTART